MLVSVEVGGPVLPNASIESGFSRTYAPFEEGSRNVAEHRPEKEPSLTLEVNPFFVVEI